jgi:hypothetical protein
MTMTWRESIGAVCGTAWGEAVELPVSTAATHDMARAFARHLGSTEPEREAIRLAFQVAAGGGCCRRLPTA